MRKTQESSQDVCRRRSGYLVEINNVIEHHNLMTKLQEIHSTKNSSWNTWWIGLNLIRNDNMQAKANVPSVDSLVKEGSGLDLHDEIEILDLDDQDAFSDDSKWVWSDSGSSLSAQEYTGWLDSSSNIWNGDCVTIDYHNSWLWKSANCNQKHFFVCEINTMVDQII